jgi:hypothetical protein
MPRRDARHHHHVYVVEPSDQVWNEASFRKANPDWQLGKPTPMHRTQRCNMGDAEPVTRQAQVGSLAVARTVGLDSGNFAAIGECGPFGAHATTA